MLQILFIIPAIILSLVVTSHMMNAHGGIIVAREEKIHQYLLNLLGVLSGWAAFYYLVFYRFGYALEPMDLLLIFVAFIGIMGYIPHIIINKGFKP